MVAVNARPFVIFYLMLLAMAATTDATATSLATRGLSISGCQQLANTVSNSLEATLRMQSVDPFQWPKRYQVMPTAVAGQPVSCGTTAAVTSAAFSATLAAYGFDVGWNNGVTGHPADQCLSHYISQCYPEFRAGQMPPTDADRALVSDAWLGVHTGVRLHMPFGPRSDLVYFEPALLDATLTTSLAVSLAQTARRYDIDGGPVLQ